MGSTLCSINERHNQLDWAFWQHLLHERCKSSWEILSLVHGYLHQQIICHTFENSQNIVRFNFQMLIKLSKTIVWIQLNCWHSSQMWRCLWKRNDWNILNIMYIHADCWQKNLGYGQWSCCLIWFFGFIGDRTLQTFFATGTPGGKNFFQSGHGQDVMRILRG